MACSSKKPRQVLSPSELLMTVTLGNQTIEVTNEMIVRVLQELMQG